MRPFRRAAAGHNIGLNSLARTHTGDVVEELAVAGEQPAVDADGALVSKIRSGMHLHPQDALMQTRMYLASEASRNVRQIGYWDARDALNSVLLQPRMQHSNS